MHRRDYELIARVLKKVRRHYIPEAEEYIISEFSSELKAENHTFNEKKFREAIQGKEKKNDVIIEENV